ncbi:MAG: hypothetical protein KIS66_00235 [Fimbriimonadaceae bacterium]|nr:hypothetical protein [Fimbriimonadaceae bacterium]
MTSLLLALTLAAPTVVTLKSRPVATVSEMLSLSMNGVGDAVVVPQPGDGGVSAPEAKNPYRLTLTAGTETRALVADMKGEAIQALYADLNGDRTIGPDERLAANKVGDWTVFGPFDLPAGKRPARLALLQHPREGLILAHAECFEASVALNGKSTKVAIVDANLSGVLGDGRGNRDGIAVDFDGNGHYDGWGDAGFLPEWGIETVPLESSVQMADGRLYAPSVKDLELTLTPLPGPDGVLVFPRKQGALTLNRKGESLWVRGVDGKAVLPAGEYAVEVATLPASTGALNDWSVSYLSVGDRDLVIRMGVGQDLPAPLHGPYAAKVQWTKEGDEVRFDAWIEDADKRHVSIARPAGARANAPVLQILDANGNPVHKVTMETDDDFHQVAVWKPERSTAGLRARVVFDGGPLKLAPAEVRL